ncbi:MAG: undecaprenyl-diphosphatase UppP [Patescibacteria group bacterium]
MTYIHALILGIIEGITEFLPVSSTAHLDLSARLLSIPTSEFLKTFEIAIQLGAILAVVIIYASWLKRSRELWKRIIIAFLPTGIIGFVLYKLIKSILLGNIEIMVWTLGIGGIVLILFELLYKEKPKTVSSEQELETLSYKKAFIIGLVQAIAVIPGVSRSAATVIAGRSLGVSRQAIVEFSFLLAIPTMAAATGYSLLKEASSFSSHEFSLLGIGFVAAFISALIAVKTFLKYIRNHTMIGFGIYRIFLALALLGILYS